MQMWWFLLSPCFGALFVADLNLGMGDLELRYRCRGRLNFRKIAIATIAVRIVRDPWIAQRQRDDNKNKICVFEGGGIGGREENRSKTLFSLGNPSMTISRAPRCGSSPNCPLEGPPPPIPPLQLEDPSLKPQPFPLHPLPPSFPHPSSSFLQCPGGGGPSWCWGGVLGRKGVEGEAARKPFTWGAPDSSFRAFSLHPLQKSKNQKIKKWSLRNDCEFP